MLPALEGCSNRFASAHCNPRKYWSSSKLLLRQVGFVLSIWSSACKNGERHE